MNTELLLMLVKEDQGKYLAALNPWKIPREEIWRQKFFFEMWTSALKNNSLYGYHTLAIYTPREYLDNAIELAMEEHSVGALVSLLGKKYPYDGRKDAAKLLFCLKGNKCEKCLSIKFDLFKWFS
jgi:hypothetical protein